MNATPAFAPHQIVRLSHQASCLYAEVVQVADARDLCWVRPLVLVESEGEQFDSDAIAQFIQAPAAQDDAACGAEPDDAAQSIRQSGQSVCIYDLRQSADLLWPLCLFQAALDTEVAPLLTWLYQSDAAHSKPICLAAPQQLRGFMERVWQDNIALFQPSAP